MHGFTAAYLIIFGLVALIGGIQGYAVKGSMASLVMGGLSGVLLMASGGLLYAGKTWALWIAILVSAALAGRFLVAFAKDTSNVWPALIMGAMGVVGLGFALATLFGRKAG